MLYDIYLNHSTGKWRIRLVRATVLLFTRQYDLCHVPAGTDEPIVREFDTFDAAEVFAEDTGLNDAYTRRFPLARAALSEALCVR
jgi:hypothetical protein